MNNIFKKGNTCWGYTWCKEGWGRSRPRHDMRPAEAVCFLSRTRCRTYHKSETGILSRVDIMNTRVVKPESFIQVNNYSFIFSNHFINGQGILQGILQGIQAYPRTTAWKMGISLGQDTSPLHHTHAHSRSFYRRFRVINPPVGNTTHCAIEHSTMLYIDRCTDLLVQKP